MRVIAPNFAQILLVLVLITPLALNKNILYAQNFGQKKIAFDFFPNEDLIHGTILTESDCENIKKRGGGAVWITHRLGSECIRYFTSESAKKPINQAVILFNADRLSGNQPISYEDNSTPALEYYLNLLENWQKTPFIMIARSGTYGSSGNHNKRRQTSEYLSMDAALSEVKKIFGLKRLIIAGQSGGANTVAAILTLGRKDILCAVGSSGNYDAASLGKIRAAKAGVSLPANCDTTGYCDLYTITDHVNGIYADNKRKIFIIGNPDDTNTLFEFQQVFYEKIKQAGHWVQLIKTGGLGDSKHDVTGLMVPTAASCAK